MTKKKGSTPIANLAEDIAKTINKKTKNTTFQMVKGIQNDHLSKVKTWIPSGCDLINLAITNTPKGGYPAGRLTVFFGPEQSGKSLAAMHALAETQKMGGIGVFIDSENALHEGFAEAIGLNLTDLWYSREHQLEVIFPAIEETIHVLRAEYGKDKPITIVLDSMASCVTAANLENAYEGKGYDTSKSMRFSSGFTRLMPMIAQQNICLIVTNQVKYKMNIQNPKFEDPWRQPGGQSVPHFSSVMIQFKKLGKIKATVNGIERVIGRETRATITKNRLGPPESTFKFDVYFDRGIDNFESWKEYATTKFKIVTTSGAYVNYDYVDTETGEVINYRGNGWTKFTRDVLEQHPKVAEQIWNKICDNYIVAYQKKSSEVEIVRESDATE